MESERFLYQNNFILIESPSHFDEILIKILVEESENCEKITKNILNLLKESKLDWQYLSLLSMISVKMSLSQKILKRNIKLLNHARFDLHWIAVRILQRLEIALKIYIYLSKIQFLLFYNGV